ncbi:MAG: redoxin family protein [Nanoarchaeota archaeon]|nr:redoxin family protein [Nanoarchaeota archaeon]
MLNKKEVRITVIIIAIVLVSGFVFFSSNSKDLVETEKISAASWINFELKDVATGEKFKISDFNDKPILLESFAVWCPTCTQQQKITKKFHEEVGDSVVSISIDTDPNEDESRVLEHIERNGFDWYYAIAPVEMTRSLIDQFGVGIVNAPAVPMILICGNDNVKKLDSGIKSVSELKKEVANCKI